MRYWDNNNNIQIDERLNNLTEEEIYSLISDYRNTKKTTSELINEYSLNSDEFGTTAKNSLRSSFPPLKSDLECTYCKTPMYYKVPGRNSYFKEVEEYFCPSCGHQYFPNASIWGKKCNCNNCQETEDKIKKIKLEKIKSQYNTDEIVDVEISDVLGKDYDYIETLLDLLMLYDMTNYESLKYITKKQKNFYTQEHPDHLIPYIKKLKNAGLLYPMSDSSIDSYVFDENNNPSQFYLSKVNYYVAVDINQDEKKRIIDNRFFLYSISTLSESKEFYENIGNRIYEKFINLAVKDILKQFGDYLEERRIYEFDNTIDKEREFRDLFNHISYSQILCLSWRVARDVGDKVTAHQWSKDNASERALQQIHSYYVRAVENDWEFKQSLYPKYSVELLSFLNVLGFSVDILRQTITRDVFVKKIIDNIEFVKEIH